MYAALFVRLKQHKRSVIFVRPSIIPGAEHGAQQAVVVQLVPAFFDLVGANDHGNAIAIAKLLCARFAE